MQALAVDAFVVASGLTFSGLVGTVIEIIAGRRLSLGEPFVSARNISRSLVLVLLAGPFMVLNEVLAANRDLRFGWMTLVGIACFLLLWAAAMGVFVLGLVEGVRQPVG